MSMDTVHKSPMTFGTAGTQTSVAHATTSTTNQGAGFKGNYSVQLTCIATGTSGVGATVVWQGSNDALAWVPISSATVTASQAGTGTTYGASVIAVSGPRVAFTRGATVIVTGTGAATVTLGA